MNHINPKEVNLLLIWREIKEVEAKIKGTYPARTTTYDIINKEFQNKYFWVTDGKDLALGEASASWNVYKEKYDIHFEPAHCSSHEGDALSFIPTHMAQFFPEEILDSVN